MISRYQHENIHRIFSPLNRVQIFTKIELARVCEPDLLDSIDIERLYRDMIEVEKTTRHETVAFVEALSLQIEDPTTLQLLHLGMTSSDVLDTCLSIQMRQSCDVLLEEISLLIETLANFALKYKNVEMVGRSHGKAGELITLGFSLLTYYEEWSRNFKRVILAKDEISYGMFSGPMGNYTNIEPELEPHICKVLDKGLKPEPVSTQVIPRDRHAFLMSVLGVVGASLERLSTHIRNLSQSGIGEVSESFNKGQKGSSAMPHKKNPILSENVTGLSRLLKANVAPSLDNVALWYERDMSHSSVERVTVEDSFHLSCFGVRRIRQVVENLAVDEFSLKNNIAREGDLVFSHSVLCHLIRCGITRNEAYGFIQEVTHKRLNLFSELESRFPSHFISLEELHRASKSNVEKVFDRTLGHISKDRELTEGLKNV